MKTSVIEVHDMLSVLTVDEVEERIGGVPGVESATKPTLVAPAAKPSTPAAAAPKAAPDTKSPTPTAAEPRADSWKVHALSLAVTTVSGIHPGRHPGDQDHR